MQKNVAGFLVAVAATLSLALGMGEVAAYQVQSTGQTDCWDNDGVEIPCKGTGQDGETQAGLGFKKFDRYMGFKRPTKRFKRNGAWVTDKLTGLRWYIEIGAECGESNTWDCALEGAKKLGGRLPNIRELQTMIEYMPTPPEDYPYDKNTLIPDPEPVDYWSEGTLSVWSSTTCPHYPERAYGLDLWSGVVFCSSKELDSATEWAVKSPRNAYEGMINP